MSRQARGQPSPAISGEAGGAPVAAVDLSTPGEGSGRPVGCGASEAADEIRERLERAEHLLLRPSALSAAQAAVQLERCCHLLGAAEHAPSGAWRGAAQQWRSSLLRLELLSAGALSLSHGWAAASGLGAGYTASGEDRPVVGGARRLDHSG